MKKFNYLQGVSFAALFAVIANGVGAETPEAPDRDYFSPPAADDIWSAKIQDWQQREGDIQIPKNPEHNPQPYKAEGLEWHGRFAAQMEKWRAQVKRDEAMAEKLAKQDVVSDVPEIPRLNLPDFLK